MSLRQKYEDAMHAVQSGIQMMISLGHDDFVNQEHMLVGVDSAHISNAAIVEILIIKKMITLEEYEQCLVVCAEEERDKWEKKLSKLMGTSVKLS